MGYSLFLFQMDVHCLFSSRVVLSYSLKVHLKNNQNKNQSTPPYDFLKHKQEHLSAWLILLVRLVCKARFTGSMHVHSAEPPHTDLQRAECIRKILINKYFICSLINDFPSFSNPSKCHFISTSYPTRCDIHSH